MRFAPVAPPHILQYLKDRGVLGSYHLLLAHDILQKPDAYRQVFHRQPIFPEVRILDNSVIELGESVDGDTIAQAAEVVQANVIVLPDKLCRDGSWRVSLDALDPWKQALNKRIQLDYEFMVVPQGETLEGWIRCAEKLAKHDRQIGWWGIPRNFERFGPRSSAVKILQALHPKRKIHLLGFSERIYDDVTSTAYAAVAGIDSAVPLRTCTHSAEPFGLTTNLPPRGYWWDTVTPSLQMLEDLRTARSIFANV